MIAGRTHPDVAHREGERYRLTLEQAVLELGLEDHVEFDDRFLAIDEIADLLAATDVFVTPYREREQIASGALTFGDRRRLRRRLDAVLVRAGHARVGRGPIVPFADSGRARRRRLPRTSSEPERLAAARAEARRIGAAAGLAVGRRGDRVGAAARRVELAPRRRRPVVRLDPQLVSMRTDHLLTLVDDVGIVQHANGVIPNRDTRLLRRRRRPARGRRARARPPRRRAGLDVDPLPLARVPAGRDRPGRRGMRNFMGYDRRWLDEPHVGDHVGRSVWALGEILVHGLGARRRRPDRATCSTRSSARSPDEVVAAHRRLRRARARAARRRTGSSRRRSACSSGCVDQLADALRGARRRRTGAGSRTRSPTTTRGSRTR